MKNVSDKLCEENQNTHFTFNQFFPPENRAIHEKIWKNIVELGRPQTTIWCMHIACLILKATNTHSEYVILGAFSLQQRSYESASMLRHSYIVCFVNIILSSTLRFPK